jgi:hypothetical protein
MTVKNRKKGRQDGKKENKEDMTVKNTKKGRQDGKKGRR